MIARLQHTAEYVAQLRLIANQSQQGLAARALHTDAEDVLGSRIQVDNEEIVVNEDDARAEAVENSFGIVGKCSATMAGTPVACYGPVMPLTVFCCT